jgi:quercetin dioxygenase-like cupin family protein
LAAGPIAAALAGATVGAAAGGLIGALNNIGVPTEEATYYVEGVRRGGTVLTVRAEDSQVSRVVEIMQRHRVVNIDERVAQWRHSGWTETERVTPPSPTSIPADKTPRPSLNLDEGRVVLKESSQTFASTASPPAPHAATADTSVTKVNSRYSPRGDQGQKYLAAGVRLSMRLWENEQPGQRKPQTQRDYETVGYVIQGRAELSLEGQTVLLEPGDSWIVPKGSVHSYRILEPFTAVEVTSPPAEVHSRDK